MEAMLLPRKLGAVVALIAIGLLASIELAWPARDVYWGGLSFTLSGRMLLGLIVVGLAWTGADVVVQQHRKVHAERPGLPFSHSILPAALTAAAWVLLAQPDSIRVKIVGVVAASGLLAFLIIAECSVGDLTERWRAVAQLCLRLITYWVATLLYTAIHLSTSEDLPATIAVVAASVILGVKLLSDDGSLPHRIPAPDAEEQGVAAEMPGRRFASILLRHNWLCGVGAGVLLGVISGLLNHWVASPLIHSLGLVVLLYVLVGIVRHFLLGTLTQQVALEYLFVGVLVVLLLLPFAR